MSIRKFARRLLSPSTAREFWKSNSQPNNKARLGTDTGLEDRTVPAITVNYVAATGIATVVNDNATNETVNLKVAGGKLIVDAGADLAAGQVTGDAVFNAGTKNAEIDAATVKIINLTTGSTKFLQTTVQDVSGAAALRTVNYTGSDVGDNVNLQAANNANVYFNVDMKGGAANTYAASDTGVNILAFSDAGAAASVIVTPSATNSKMALNFKNVTTDVAANLAVTAGGLVASYTNMQVTLTAGKTADNIIGVYGSKGNDTLIGNAQANILVGFDGNDTIIGNGGNDQLNANRDFAPSLPGLTNTGGVATSSATTVIDVSQFAAVSTAFGGVAGQNPTAAALFNAFGFFSFGEGVAALTGAAGVSPTSLGADFTTANGITATQSADTLIGGDGNDGLYGFNTAAVTASGGLGDDVFSTNTAGLASTYDGGAGNDLLIGAPGFTLLGGAGMDNISFAVANTSAPQPLQSTAVGGADNDTIMGSFLNVTMDAGQGTDTIAIANDATNVLIFNATTNIAGGVAAIPLVKRAQR